MRKYTQEASGRDAGILTFMSHPPVPAMMRQ
jgi:hypothetical protein